jgi:hypothetical protein
MSFRRLPLKAAVVLCILCRVSISLYAQGGSPEGRRGRSTVGKAPPPEAPAVEPALAETAATYQPMLAGTDKGLFSLDTGGAIQPLWTGGAVSKIFSIGGEGNETWILLGSEGILVSTDLQNWESRNRGLPVKTIKIFQDGSKSFLPTVQEIKDLEINPANTDIMVCATKDRVYLSRNQGRSWTSLGAPPYRTNGIKAVAVAAMPAEDGNDGELTVFISHSTYGVFYIHPDKSGAQWIEINKGIEQLETTGNADEVSDIAITLNAGLSGSASPWVFVSQTFRHRLYQLDWRRKTFNLIWSDESPFGTLDSLAAGKNSLRFLMEGAIAEIDYPDGMPVKTKPGLRMRQDIIHAIRAMPGGARPNCVALRENQNNGEPITLNELWLLDEDSTVSEPAAGKEGLYLPVNHAMNSNSLKPYLDVISGRALNMIVIDMKDDYGRLRFAPRNPAINGKGRVFRPLDIDAFLRDMQSRGIYTVARVVVFKDPELARRENGKYAVWDARYNRPWAGYHDTRRNKADISDEDRQNQLIEFLPADDPQYEIVRTYYDERWVDPYSEEVWEYTAAVAAELHERGFDEIQFDYIRFPTDGVNLGSARYRWQENGMDMESAMISFLRHIRGRVKAPISIDIYGANGWYRTGARTGQEVEMLAPWVDVICPMYYPSHFEQDFLAQSPPELRPYRIYFQGTLRTARIGRGRIIVRPYAQAFYLNVSYDRKYYNADYVRRELEGVRAAGTGGLTYWNNSGRYDDIPVQDSKE